MENSEKILTIVVPSYNAEKYLRKNLDTLCRAEVADDIEILVINDGSTDGTAQIAAEYEKRFPGTVVVVNKENGGHGSGINTGISLARGLYFKVIDADDWVDEKTFHGLVKKLKAIACGASPADIVYSGFLWARDNGSGKEELFEKKAEISLPLNGLEEGKIYSFDEVADRVYIKMHSMTIRTEILRAHNIRVDEHCFYVDTEYILFPIPYVRTIAFHFDYVYMYRIGGAGQSVSMEKMRRNEKNYDTVLASLSAWYKKLGREIACSEKSKRYIAGIIARAVAGKMKILLSYTPSADNKKRLVTFDKDLKRLCPDVWNANINPAIKLLRRTGYLAYLPVCILVQKKYR